MNLLDDTVARIAQFIIFHTLQKGKKPNSFAPAAETKKQRIPNGGYYKNDICYGAKYPNSYFDIWYGVGEDPKPTIVYGHGGGYLFGDKLSGDPLAKQSVETGKFDMGFFREWTARGYNVVSYNYCLAPKYRAWDIFDQLSQLMCYLVQHGEELALDMSNVVLAGGSAGAGFSAIYSLAVCDADYAKRLGIDPALSKDCLKCCVLDEASMNVFAKDAEHSLFATILVGERKIQKSKWAEILDVSSNVRDCYVPCYMTASNQGDVFKNFAFSMKEKLDRIGVENEVYYRTEEESEKILHGFVSNFLENPYAKEAFDGEMAFLDRHCKKAGGGNRR